MYSLLTILADASMVAPIDVAAKTVETNPDLWNLTLKGGIIMIPLLLLSVIAIYVFIERYIAIRKAAYEDNTFMLRIKDYIHEGDIDAARTLCKKSDTPYARLIEKGISRLGRPMNDVLVA
ncbi:MAG: MotA/TolQ/ExbB proton channel family protein, partial [Bacteroidales bacterium]